eukprot:TRINITY_DN52368_c0_g1_i1.p1 TRINITY_DN52368_c0_g1~~TRINITY_DN52368_c0_g1_i1.p1  ORF type:complete len:1378 (-),score=402.38 TRINITY_DN52368_c0_g1_i1:228-4361(-)
MSRKPEDVRPKAPSRSTGARVERSDNASAPFLSSSGASSRETTSLSRRRDSLGSAGLVPREAAAKRRSELREAPPGLPSTGTGSGPLFRPPPGLSRPGGFSSSSSALPTVAADRESTPDARRRNSASADEEPFETFGEESFDEEMELLRAEADLVAAAADIATTSADDDTGTTDPDYDDDEDGIAELPTASRGPSRAWSRSPMASVVIEDDEEDISSGVDDLQGSPYESDVHDIRRRLWAQSLLRLKRSIDEIYLLVEYESDEGLCEQVQGILEAASGDFGKLSKQLESQHVYHLMAGEFPFKSGVAWTTRTPRASKSGESVLEALEKVQSPLGAAARAASRNRGSLSRSLDSNLEPLKNNLRASSLDRQGRPALLDEGMEADEMRAGGGATAAPGTGEAGQPEVPGSRLQLLEPPESESETSKHSQVQLMVETTLESIHSRLGRHQPKPDPEELRRRSQERQWQASALRAQRDSERMQEVRKMEERIEAARERRLQKEQRDKQRERDLLEKMSRARRQYQDQLRQVTDRARRENRKSAEVAFIQREAIKGERELLRRKHENAQLGRMIMKEKMRKKLMDTAQRVKKVSENRKKQVESWQHKVQQELEEKERLAALRREERLKSVKQKSQGQDFRSEMVRGKKREIIEEGERSGVVGQHLGHKLSQLSCCDSLPAGVREEVAEQLTAKEPAGSSALSAAEGGGASGKSGAASKKAPCLTRESTPPPPERPRQNSCLTPTPTRSPSVIDQASEPGDGEQEASSSQGGGRAAARDASPEQEGVHRSGAPDAMSIPEFPRHLAEQSSKAVSPSQSRLQSPKATTHSPSNAAVMRKPTLEEKTDPAALEALRTQLTAAAMSDDDALKLASGNDGKPQSVNAAHRGRVTKLAAELSKLFASDDVLAFNLDRAETLLNDFCKVLSPSQREADYAFVLQRGCGALISDICLRIKTAIEKETEKEKAAKQNAVILAALKWLGLLSKQKVLRMFMLVTNRMVALADVATACLDTTAASVGGAVTAGAASAPEAQSISFLCLPQVLHILSLHLKQSLPEAAPALQAPLVSYLLLCGLPMKLRDLFRRVESRGMRHFDGASSVPLLLLRATGFLGTLVSLYQIPDATAADASAAPENSSSLVTSTPSSTSPVLKILRQTELFGLVSMLVSILLGDGGQQKKQQHGADGSKKAAPSLPQTVVSLCLQVVRIFNSVARISLTTMQETLGGSCGKQELYHLMLCLFDYCSSRLNTKKDSPGQDENDLLHEVITLLGFYCLNCPDNQGIMSYGEGQPLLSKVASLPLYYFMDERGKQVLFPTILAACYQSEHNLELLRNEMNLSLLRDFLVAAQAGEPRDEALGGRFPPSLWAGAVEFFKDEVPSPVPSQDG